VPAAREVEPSPSGPSTPTLQPWAIREVRSSCNPKASAFGALPFARKRQPVSQIRATPTLVGAKPTVLYERGTKPAVGGGQWRSRHPPEPDGPCRRGSPKLFPPARSKVDHATERNKIFAGHDRQRTCRPATTGLIAVEARPGSFGSVYPDQRVYLPQHEKGPSQRDAMPPCFCIFSATADTKQLISGAQTPSWFANL